MSLKRNVLANYVSQIYVTMIGIFMVPVYMRYMGVEAYGLVGFYTMLQAWFQVLDMGLTPTMARESARFQGGASDALQLRRLLRAMEGIFVAIAIIGCVTLIYSANFIAGHWLKVQQLSIREVQLAIVLMAIIVGLRWICGLYRGAITGFEQLVWLGGFNIVFATARFVLVIPLFIYVGHSPLDFFSYQLALAIIETMVLIAKVYSLLPSIHRTKYMAWDWAPLRGVLKFSASISVASLAWIMVTQADKVVLSKVLTLTDYGYFSLVAMIAAGVQIISGPISAAILPRITKLSAENNMLALIDLYRFATQLVVAVSVPTALVLSLFSTEVLWVWTGNEVLVEKIAPVLALYAIGSGVSVIAAFPYYLQYAFGNMKLHLVGSFLFVSVFVPILLGSANIMGMEGAGWAWLVSNAIYFMVWVPIVCHKIVPNLYRSWIFRDVFAPGVPVIIVSMIIRYAVVWPEGRLAVGVQLFVIASFLMIVSTLSGNKIRSILITYLMNFKKVVN